MMTDMGQRLLAISKRLRANKDLDKIAGDARAIHKMAGKIAAQLPGSMHLRLLRSRWFGSNGMIQREGKKLQIEAEKLSTTSPADGDGLRKQFRAVAYACDGCHETYRLQKGNDR